MDQIVDWFSLRRILGALFLPPAGFLIVTILGLLLWRRRPRLGATIVVASVAGLWIVATPLFADWLETEYTHAQPLDPKHADKAQAVVILGGGLSSRALEYGGFTMSQLTAERVRYGARVARQLGLPILVTGGVPQRGWPAEGDVMAEALRNEYLLDVRWIERRSRNTRQNAQFSGALLRKDGVKHILLVTHGVDLDRGRREFEAQGFDIVSAPTRIPWVGAGRLESIDFIPNVQALRSSYYVFYEWAAAIVNGDPPRFTPESPAAAGAR